MSRQTPALMKTVLERVCQALADGREPEVRGYIAEKILNCAQAGDKTLA